MRKSLSTFEALLLPDFLSAQGNEGKGETTFSQYLTGASVGVSLASTAVDGLEYSRYSQSRFGGFWLGKNGKYYPTSWGGNGATGGMLKFAQARINPYAKAGGRILGVASIGFGVFETYQGLSNRDLGRTIQGTADAGFAAWATFGGPVGWAAGGGYAAGSLINAVTGFDQNFADFWVYGPGSEASSDQVIEQLRGGPFW